MELQMTEIKKNTKYLARGLKKEPQIVYVHDLWKDKVLFFNTNTGESHIAKNKKFARFCTIATPAELVLYGK